MASRSVQINLDIQGANTIGEMESNIDAINQALKLVDVNSDAFTDLSKKAQEANEVLERTNAELEGVTSQQKADAAVKLGEGLVGGFAAAQSAAALFGAESSEALEQASQRAVLLFTALDGVKKVTETFSAETIKGLKGIVKGFTQSTVGATLFGNATRAALTATGIGALIVGIGLLIANWDKVTAAVSKFKDEIITTLKFIAPPLGFLIAGIDSLIEKFGSFQAIFAGVVESAKALFTFNFGDIADAFERGAKAAQELAEAQEELNQFNDEGNKAFERTIKLLESQGDQEKRIFELKKEQLETNIQLLANVKNLSDEEQDRLTDLLFELEVLKNQEKRRLEALELEKAKTAEAEKQKKLAEDLERIQKSLEDAYTAIDKRNQSAVDLAEREEEIRFNNLSTQEKILQRQEDIKKITQDKILLDETIEKLQEKNRRIGAMTADDLVNQNKLTQLIIEAQTRRNELDLEELNAKEEIKELEGELTAEQIRQLELWNQLNEELKQFQDEELQKKLQNIATGIGFVGQAASLAFQQQFNILDEELNRLDLNLRSIQDEIEDFYETQIDYEEQLKDANGERFTIIQEQLKLQEAEEKRLLQAEVDAENQLIDAENRRAEAEKRQAIVQSIIDGALAVVQALPNPVLAAITGVLAGVQTSIIASQQVPKIPPVQVEFEEGGFTQKASSDSKAVGVVHANEYVVPANVLRTSEGTRMAETLEAMRLDSKRRGFQEGGFTSQPNSVSRLDTQANNVVRALESANIFVSVSEINDVNTNVRVLETKASL